MTADCMAFVQNQQHKVRYFGGDGSLVGAIPAQPGAVQQTFLMESIEGGGIGG